MYELKKKIGNVLTSKFVGTGPSSYEKRIYRAAVSQRLRNTVLKELSTDSKLRALTFTLRKGRKLQWNNYQLQTEYPTP